MSSALLVKSGGMDAVTQQIEEYWVAYEKKGGRSNWPPCPGENFYFDTIEYKWKPFTASL